MSLLEVSGLDAWYGRKSVLQNLDFSLEPGTVMGILGANGSGKTTLLKRICGLLPGAGNCILDGESLSGLSARQIAAKCSYIPQRSGISIDISALDVVLMGFNPRLGLLEYPSKAMKAEASRALALAGLAGMDDRNYLTLSEGQKQLCILARTMVSDAKLLLLDEPESALDFGGRYRMLQSVRQWVGEKRGAVVTLHDPQLALNCCDRLLLLRDGKALGILSPGADPLPVMEEALVKLYGNLTMMSVKNQLGQAQFVLVK